MYELLIMVLATWRISIFLVYDDLFNGMRERMNVGMTTESGLPINPIAWMLDCFWCCSIIIALLVSLLSPCVSILEILMRPFAISGGAIMLHYMCRIHLQLGD